MPIPGTAGQSMLVAGMSTAVRKMAKGSMTDGRLANPQSAGAALQPNIKFTPTTTITVYTSDNGPPTRHKSADV